MSNKRILELDALRGIAALAVLIYHYFFRYDMEYAHQGVPVSWSYYGHLGVNLFFMISGYVIFMTLDRVRRPMDFVVSRFARLYPAYWAAVILTFLVVAAFGLPGREVSPLAALLNLLMFQEFLKIPHVDGVYWTLTVELTFYFWIFLLYLSRNLARVDLAFGALAAVGFLHSAGFVDIPFVVRKILILEHLPFFLAGICFYRIANGWNVARSSLIALLALASCIPGREPGELLTLGIFALVCFGAMMGRLRFLAFPPLVYLGAISYSLYLLHQNIGYVIIRAFYDHGLPPLPGILAATGVTLVLASLFFACIEKPARRKLRDLYAAKREGRLETAR